MMQMHFGDDTDDFVGKRITLRPDRTPNPQGQIVDCIRVDGELPEQKAQAAPVAANSADDDDDLPFSASS
jgi:hypothetical protein